jgi:hypothetical protein
MLQNVYRGDRPAAYLAGHASFLFEHRQHPFVQNLVRQSFDCFFANHVQPLHSEGCAMGVVGSAAFLFADILADVAQQYGVAQPQILRYPIEPLARYHAAF